jgi:two-component system OmpR family response regulator
VPDNRGVLPAAPLEPSASPARPTVGASLIRADGTPVKVLVVDDERIVAEMVSMTLRCEGADVVTAGDAAAAVSAARRHRADVAIVDPGLPDADGMALLHLLRERQPGLLLLLLSSEVGEPDRKMRFSTGDLWLAKPFSIEDVLSRIRMMFRRADIKLLQNSAVSVVGDLVLDEDSREVSRAGEHIQLSHSEFELLRFFVRNAGRVVTKQQILGRVWPYDYSGRTSVVELYVSYLRKKIDHERDPMIHTLRRAGYLFKASSSP